MRELHEIRPEISILGALVERRIPLQERVRHRFKQLVEERRVPHDILGKYLGLSRSAVTRLLNDEGSGFALTHMEKLCEFFQITAAEIMVEHGALVQPVQPLEAQLLKIFRDMTELERRALLDVLDRGARRVPTHRLRRARSGRVDLTEEQQLVVDLYVRSNAAAREGVLKVLRGTARAADRDRPDDTTG